MKKKLYKIRGRYSGKVLFKGRFLSIKQCVEAAIECRVNLRGADLRGVDLNNLNFKFTNLSGVDFTGSKLQSCNFNWCDINGAILINTDLRNSSFIWANLSWSSLCEADLRGVGLGSADLRFCDLRTTKINKKQIKLIDFQICPQQGSFQAWKQLSGNYIALIEIPSGAKRTGNIMNRKCRASYVRTLKIYKNNKSVRDKVYSSRYCLKLKYEIGKITRADSFNSDPCQDNTNGIHFFMTRQEAKKD